MEVDVVVVDDDDDDDDEDGDGGAGYDRIPESPRYHFIPDTVSQTTRTTKARIRSLRREDADVTRSLSAAASPAWASPTAQLRAPSALTRAVTWLQSDVLLLLVGDATDDDDDVAVGRGDACLIISSSMLCAQTVNVVIFCRYFS